MANAQVRMRILSKVCQTKVHLNRGLCVSNLAAIILPISSIQRLSMFFIEARDFLCVIVMFVEYMYVVLLD